MIAAVVAFLTLQGGPMRPPPAAAAVPAKDREQLTVDSLEAHELRFFHQWGDAYSLSYDYAKDHGGFWALQQALIECTPFRDRVVGKEEEVTAWKGRIQSSRSVFAVCPSWPLMGPLAQDESRQIDLALNDRFRESMRVAREALIGFFGAANTEFPKNEWISGQLVRLLSDQSDLDRALAAANACQGRPQWCHALSGFVLTQRGKFAAADSAFDRAVAAMSAAERCKWTDASFLLDSASKAAYEQVPCAKRDSVQSVLWWLADPLWMEAGNERRAIQYSRRVSVDLRTALNRDERWNWQPMLGGDALSEMVLRYGWPTYTFWPGLKHDRPRTGRYLVALFRGAINPPYTSFEYSTDRLQTFPQWRTVAKPLEAKNSDWELGSPRPIGLLNQPDDTVRGANISSKEVVKRTNEWWWPANHFRPKHPTGQMSEGEHVFLRRETVAVFATIVDVPPLLQRSSNADADVALVVSSGPTQVQNVASSFLTLGPTLTLFGLMPSKPALVGVEIVSAHAASLAARNRYGVTPPMPLTDIATGAHAISDIVMVHAPPGDNALPIATDSILNLMRKPALAPGTTKFALYWETYGIAPTDTVEIAVWVERFTPQGIFRNLGVAMNVARDLNTPIANSWTEAGVGRNAHVIPGRVPVIGRSVVLDATALRPGEYWLDVVVKKAGREPLRTRRTFAVLPR